MIATGPARVPIPVSAVVVPAAIVAVVLAPVGSAVILALSLGRGLAVSGSFGFGAVLVDDFLRLFLRQIGELHFGEGFVDDGHFKIGLHLHDGRVGNVFALFGDSLLGAHLGLIFRRNDDDRFALEPDKVRHLALLSRLVDVGLVENVVPPPLGRNLQKNVEAACALFNEHLPSAAVVFAPSQAVHLHLLEESVGADHVEFALGVFDGEFVGPRRLASAGQAAHHNHLTVAASEGCPRASDPRFSRTLARPLEPFQRREPGLLLLPEIDLESAILREDVREEGPAVELILLNCECHALRRAVDRKRQLNVVLVVRRVLFIYQKHMFRRTAH